MDDLKKGFVGVTKAITKGSGALIKTTKISLSLTNEESKLNSLYTEIGKKVHEIYRYGGSIGEYFDEKYQQILEQQRRIDELKAARDVAKGIVTCAKCGKTSPRGSVFCPKCGGSIGEGEAAEESEAAFVEAGQMPPVINEEPPAVPEVVLTKICNVCGSANAVSDRFCLSCGRIL